MEGRGGRPQAATGQGILQISLAKTKMLSFPHPLTSVEVLHRMPLTFCKDEKKKKMHLSSSALNPSPCLQLSQNTEVGLRDQKCPFPKV